MRRRLLHVVTVPDSLIFLRGQCRYMRSRGYEVAVLGSPPSDLVRRFADDEGIRSFVVPMERRITPFADLLALDRLSQIIREFDPTIVHAHTPKGGLLGTFAAHANDVPIRIYHMRGLPMMTATGWQKQLLRTTELLACASATTVLCQSRSLREVAVAERLGPSGKLQVLGDGSNGVDTNRFSPDRFPPESRAGVRRRFGIPEDAIVIGFVGRLVGDKGVRELVAAWSILRKRYSSLYLLLVGPFEPRDPIPEEVKTALREDSRVRLTGGVREPDEYYSIMDLVTLPSYREGFPNVPLEAAAMQLPVVSTSVPGCVDAVVHDKTGLLVRPRSITELTAALDRYVSDPELRRLHGANGRARVRSSFRRETMHQRYHDFYESLLAWKQIP